jgi:hypothetical protein
MNSRMTPILMPLPTKSSIYSQKNCITRTSSVIKNVAIKGPIKDFNTSLSNFLNKGLFLILIMKETKIQFSEPEIELLANAGIILTKNKALNKMRLLLEMVLKLQLDFLETNRLFHIKIFEIPGKISKGENYLGLPYMILDYPRNFQIDNFLAVRTMFWWGNFFSSTIHISGEYLNLRELIEPQMESLAKQDYYIGVNQDPWLHHFEPTNYRKISSLSQGEFSAILNEMKHMKIAAKWPLASWQDAHTNLFKSWKFLLKTCSLIP